MPQLAGDQVPGTNRLINGGFRVWQRGTSFTGITSAGLVTADKWAVEFSTSPNSGSIDVTQSTDARHGQYSLSYNDTTDNNGGFLSQQVENMEPIQGETVTATAWMKAGSSNPASDASMQVATTVGGNFPSNSENITLTTSWKKVTVSLDVDPDATALDVNFFTPNGGEVLIDGVTLTVGDKAPDWPQVARPIGEEQSLAERYYEVNRPFDTYPVYQVNSDQRFRQSDPFATSKSAVPTLTTANLSMPREASHDDSTVNQTGVASNWTVTSESSDTDRYQVVYERSSNLSGIEYVEASFDMEAEVT